MAFGSVEQTGNTMRSRGGGDTKLDAHDEVASRLGAVLHVHDAQPTQSNLPKRAMEVTGVAGVALVPVGLAVVGGLMGIALAVLGGLVALASFLLSSRTHPRKFATTVTLYEKGIVCLQGKSSREILWNEVVDISCRKIHEPNKTTATAIVFDTVLPPPLLLLTGGVYSDADSSRQLLEALQPMWLAVWCRRAKVLAEHHEVRVGLATVRVAGVFVGKQEIGWQLITGAVDADGVDCLQTTDGIEPVEASGTGGLFPSAAKRLVALAADPPTLPMLPPPS